MAELLEGHTGHANFAPLSHGQTMAVSRYLQDQIRKLQQDLADMCKGLGGTNDAVAELKKQSGGANAQLAGLQDGLANANAGLEAQRSELGRVGGHVGKLQEGLDRTTDRTGKLEDAFKVDHQHLLKLEKEVKENEEEMHKLAETLKKKVQEDINELRDDLARKELDIKQMKADQDNLKDAVDNDRENQRLANMKIKEHDDRLNARDTYLKILEDRLGDCAAGLKQKAKDLEDLNTATLKLHEDHENTKNGLGEVNNNVKKVNNHVKTVHGKLEATAQGLNNVAGKLDSNVDDSDDLRKMLAELQARVQSLGEGTGRNGDSIAQLMRELSEVGATAQAVRAGLKEQSSLLLPNITMDSAEARAGAARHGSLLMSHSMGGGTTPKKTPRTSASQWT